MFTAKKWSIAFLIVVVLLLIGLGAVTVIVDPYFHYHAPLDRLQYPIYSERYQNDGIVKHFDYDAIITGMSTAENFKASEFNELFDVQSVKVPYSAGSFREINENLLRAIEANPDIRYVLRGIDCGRLFEDKDTISYNDIPVYLYDRHLYNDVYYVFNKEILLTGTDRVFDYTDSGKLTTDFDAYCNWAAWHNFGREAIEAAYERKTDKLEMSQMSEQDYERMYSNVTQNIVNTVRDNPDITFLLYFSPYSIYYWDNLNQYGSSVSEIEAQKVTTELLLQYDNVRLFSFFDEYDVICNPDNYKDTLHFTEDINSQILLWIHDGEHRLVKENYEKYYSDISDFYLNYDYDKLWK